MARDSLQKLVDELASRGYTVTICHSESHGYQIGYTWEGGTFGGGEDNVASGDTISSAAERALVVFGDLAARHSD